MVLLEESILGSSCDIPGFDGFPIVGGKQRSRGIDIGYFNNFTVGTFFGVGFSQAEPKFHEGQSAIAPCFFIEQFWLRENMAGGTINFSEFFAT